MKYLLSTIVLLGACLAQAQILSPNGGAKSRLIAKVEAVNQVISGIKISSSDETIAQLDYSGARERLTQLQNLIRIYQEMSCCKTLEPFYDEAKKFEDLISHVRDYKSFYQSADDENSKVKYKKILDDEMALYKNFLENSAWFKLGADSFKEKLSLKLDELTLPTDAEERDQALAVLARRLEKIQKKSFDFTQMELGVHEFKRDVRRLSYLRWSFPELVTDDYGTCPLNEEAAITAPVADQYACPVSSCLTGKLSSAASQLDGIKMEGLGYEMRGEKAPAEVSNRAQAIHDDIKQSNALLIIAKQLKNCMTNAQPKPQEGN